MKKPYTNVLVALCNLLGANDFYLPHHYTHNPKNRLYSKGKVVEELMKDSFCGTIGVMDEDVRQTIQQEYLSYQGSVNHPPDFMIRQGVAVEVKKIEGKDAKPLALNSSYPKDYFYPDDPKIKPNCSSCEDDTGGWEKKEMVYTIAHVEEDTLRSLWFAYGNCFCADRSVYEQITHSMEEGLKAIPNVSLSETKELGRVNGIDLLARTNLRIRGMWSLTHPQTFLKPYLSPNEEGTNLYVLIPKDSYERLLKPSTLSTYFDSGILHQQTIFLPNPNHPNETIEAILLTAHI